MEVTLGIDIGGSTTKIAALLDRKQLLASLQVETPDQITSLYGAVGKLLYENSLPLEQISEIVLTGVGSTHIREDIYGIPTYKVDEFSAIGCGGLTLCGLKEATVVSMGTGTAFVRAERSGYRHLGGSGVGGGTLAGLSRQLLNETQVSAAAELAERGNLSQVDLLVGDISAGSVSSLSPEVTAANFGKLHSHAAKADLAAGLVNLVFQTIGVLACFSCLDWENKTIAAVGTLATLPSAKRILEEVGSLHGTTFLIPENAEYATAIGAVIQFFHEKDDGKKVHS